MSQGIFSSITRMGTLEPFELQVSRGQITGHSVIQVVGFNPDVDTAWEPIWADGTLTFPTVAVVMSVSSNNTADTSNGSGARTVLVSGLDANYNQISETVVLSGTTPVNTTSSYLAINTFAVTSVGANSTASGDIYIGSGTVTAGVPAVKYDFIPQGWDFRQTAVYTVPAGYTAYIPYSRLTFAQVSGTTPVWGRLTNTGPNGVKMATVSAVANNGIVEFQPTYPIRIAEKTRIVAETYGDAVNNYVSTVFQVLLIKNNSVDA
jgi:hypothetical protein